MTVTLLNGLCLASVFAVRASYTDGKDSDERAIREVVEQRRLAWNAGDTQTYARLLTEDADILSSTGRSAYGRDEIVKLYLEQRAGAYRGAALASTVVTRIKFVRPDVALADAEAEIVGARGRDGSLLVPTKVLATFVLKKENRAWLISAIRGAPIAAIQGPRE